MQPVRFGAVYMVLTFQSIQKHPKTLVDLLSFINLTPFKLVGDQNSLSQRPGHTIPTGQAGLSTDSKRLLPFQI